MPHSHSVFFDDAAGPFQEKMVSPPHSRHKNPIDAVVISMYGLVHRTLVNIACRCHARR